MVNPVGWFEIHVDDMARARAFYEAMLGAPLSRLLGGGGPEEMWAFEMAEQGYGSAGALAKMADFATGRNSVLVYFKCEDCAVQASRAAKAGGRVERAKSSIGPCGFIALVVDTEGNLIGLHSKA